MDALEVSRKIMREIDDDLADDVSWPELEHNRGRKDECALTALCTALGLDVEYESMRFEREVGLSMGEACCDPAHYHFRTKAFLMGLWGGEVNLFFHSYPLSHDRTYEMHPDLTGVGVMTCKCRKTGDRHAVAYQDGWVYDGNAPSPLRYKRWAIEVGDDIIIDGMSLRKEPKNESK